ncbi:unnamed protein product [Cylindrotheca closterium]|uniref:GST C-terminal domain-containing protein n=1 Tax=Cylindrotheca closterium TaxID=2856 RepID=A0AAD2G5Z6_9STRA|nr:unnamed protein product [Cylindrotheca closterium]
MPFQGCFQICKGLNSAGSKRRGDLLAKVASVDFSTQTFQPNPAYPVTLLHADFCPFANRALIALLEKEENPYDPVLFESVHVCYFLGPKKDRGTGWLYSMGFKTVPVIIDNTMGGQATGESMDVVEKVDAMFSNDPLKPEKQESKDYMNAMIEKHSALIPTIYKVLMDQSVEQQKSFAKTLIEQISEMNEDLKASKGPYFCGEQFTMADIAIFPFFERLIILLGHYRGFVIPKKLSHVHTWYKTIQQRPSVKVTTSDRNEVSMSTYCFVAKERNKYLVEVYEPYAYNEGDLAKKIGAESSLPGINAYSEYKKKEAVGKA